MAKIDEKTNQIKFDATDFQAAWDNAVLVIDVDEKEIRMCYICKFIIKRDFNETTTTDQSGWVLDLINTKKPKLEHSNYIAVHANCLDAKLKEDATKVLKKIRTVEWAMME